jgi:L-ascorbate metabolism protein UlaG (beta-lactamase superfamily)
MFRYCPALLAGLLLAGTTSAAPPGKKVTIRWHAQSWFEIISSKGTRIVTDPHNLEAFGGITGVKADLVTVSHEHDDHNFTSMIANIKDPKVEVLHGLKTTNKGLEWNPIDKQFRDVHVRTVGVYHDDAQGSDRGKCAAFIFDVDGLRIAHLGDLGHQLNETQLKEIGPVDVLMIPVGGVFTINGDEAKKVVAQIKPKRYIFPMHYGITNQFEDLQTADEFLEDQKKGNIKRLRTNAYVIDTSVKPAEPVIVLLNWR